MKLRKPVDVALAVQLVPAADDLLVLLDRWHETSPRFRGLACGRHGGQSRRAGSRWATLCDHRDHRRPATMRYDVACAGFRIAASTSDGTIPSPSSEQARNSAACEASAPRTTSEYRSFTVMARSRSGCMKTRKNSGKSLAARACAP